MKRIKQKLDFKKNSIIELNTNQMKRVMGGDSIINDPVSPQLANTSIRDLFSITCPKKVI